MSRINDMMSTLKARTEESIKYYSEKEDWKPEDLEHAHKAVELYDEICEVQMKDGIWNEMKDEYGTSGARYPRISYGHDYDSYARGRDAATGRYVSRGHDDMYYDDRSYARGDRRYENSGNRRMSYDDRTSGHSVEDRMIWALEQQMDTAKSDYERQTIEKEINRIRGKQS